MLQLPACITSLPPRLAPPHPPCPPRLAPSPPAFMAPRAPPAPLRLAWLLAPRLPPSLPACVRAWVAPAGCLLLLRPSLPLLPPQVGWVSSHSPRRGALDSCFPASSQLLRVRGCINITKGQPPRHMALPNTQSLYEKTG